jgi:hypothetical protein
MVVVLGPNSGSYPQVIHSRSRIACPCAVRPGGWVEIAEAESIVAGHRFDGLHENLILRSATQWLRLAGGPPSRAPQMRGELL